MHTALYFLEIIFSITDKNECSQDNYTARNCSNLFLFMYCLTPLVLNLAHM